MASIFQFEILLEYRDIVTQSSAEGHYQSTFPGNWFYPLFSEQAEQHFSLLLVIGSVKQRVQISLWNLSRFLFFSHCSLDKSDLTGSVLFVFSSYSPPLLIPSFGYSEAEVCYYLHLLSTFLSNLFPFFFFSSWLWVRCVLLSAEGEWDGERDEKRTSCVQRSPPSSSVCART